MSAVGGHHDPLAALAHRACAAAGTTLDAVLDDLTTGTPAALTPPAIRAGWDAPDLTIPTTTRQEMP